VDIYVGPIQFNMLFYICNGTYIICFGKQVSIIRCAIKLTSTVDNKMFVAMLTILKSSSQMSGCCETWGQLISKNYILWHFTERRGRVVNAPVSYSLRPGFKSRPGDRLSYLKFFVFSSVPPGECWDGSLKLGHDRFLSSPFEFIIHVSFDAIQSSLLKSTVN
jgi:hypothetical protein